MGNEVVIKIDLKYVLMLLWILQNGHPVLNEFDRAYKLGHISNHGKSLKE